MKYSLPVLLFSLLLSSCLTDSDRAVPAATLLVNSPLEGAWRQIPRPDLLYFTGSTLELDIRGDSLTLSSRHWTDHAGCFIRGADTICEPFGWTHTYAGAFSLGADSSLSLLLKGVGTTYAPYPLPDQGANVKAEIGKVAYLRGDILEMDTLVWTGIREIQGGLFGGEETVRFVRSFVRNILSR